MGFAVDPSDIRKDDDVFFGIWEKNKDSWKAWIACETQWRVATTFAAVIYLGLDYAGVDVVLRRQSFPDAVFTDLAEMETAALEAFGEAAK
ncbi:MULTISPECIES: DUF1799 domain-containing protein [unclassified Ensifer]|uniref:DUF1799 domain-containing protein n=1 Tax=unclassified Ensifer TaxID=2633371 RepID=UPI000813213A|nr:MULTISPECIES: DUF1799 domain-containing protein [unclassified Ensifer]OCP17373.1 hypothetical protein BC361_07895 [Ensifer sp. LC54]OCP28722.1 hypothetical protein BC363_02465 [Ensifer sp. LC384]